MSRGPTRFGALDVTVLVVVGGALVLAAAFSGSIVARAGHDEELAAPAIGWRDQFYGIATPADGVIWLAGSGGKIVRSGDGGASWTVQDCGLANSLQDISAWDVDRAVAVGNDGVVVVTSDGGASWQPIEVPRSEVANKLMRVRTPEPGRAWAVGMMGMILSTTDWGVSWQRRAEEVDIAWNDIAFTDPSSGWVVGEFGSMMRTTDGGDTWENVEPVSERSLMGVAFRDRLTAVAVGLDGLILRTADGGETWVETESGTDLHLFDVVWAGTQWVAVGNMGIVLTAPGDGESWEVRRLTERDLGWHTAVAAVPGGVYVAGASQGRWADGTWTPAGTG